MDGAEILKLPGCREGEGEFVAGIEGVRLEQRVALDDGVRLVVVIDPGAGGADGTGQDRRREAEITDLDRVRRGRGATAAGGERGANDAEGGNGRRHERWAAQTGREL